MLRKIVQAELFFEIVWAAAFAILVAVFLVMGLRLGSSQPFDYRNPYGYGPVIPYGGYGPDRQFGFGDYRPHLWRPPIGEGSFWRDQSREWRTPLHRYDYIPGSRGPIPYYR